MENIVVALSNFPAVYPIYHAYCQGDILTTSIVAYVATASFVSHLFENHKHGMPGVLSLWNIHPNTKISYILNRLDVLGAGLTILRFGSLYYDRYQSPAFLLKHKLFTTLLISSFGFLFISEYDKFNPKLKQRYIKFHCS